MKATPLRSPPEKTVENSRVAQFTAEINAANGLNSGSYGAFHASSICATEAFWAKAWEALWNRASAATGPILDHAENLLRNKPQYNIICSN